MIGATDTQEGGPTMPRRDTSALKWLLGATLRNHRKGARKSLRDSADLLGVSDSKISNMESGRYGQPADEVAKLFAFYGAESDRVERIIELIEAEDEGTWWSPWSRILPEWLRLYSGLEGMANSVFVYEPLVVHALLQTEDYANAVAASARRLRPADADQVVQFRMERQRRIFEEPDSLRLHAVLEESVLHRPVGDPRAMRGQLLNLLKVAELPNVDLQVIRTDVGVHVGHNGQFTLLGFADFDDAVYVELQEDAVHLHDPAQARAYRMSSMSLRDAALGQRETASLITSLIKEL
ncbi:helix-turn-helix domain-containing protein [Solihabitans fulvus]|uniref:Helix-turn-helix domain-containing protein n=1 Tax=Solihabitans fulvus TaxID=1892852 RepID=A0A5B2XFN7_9PSEU|nr:helix-turn-helix transcriptional regulator [Solihabitans fulvus]KAA2261934.1 helix-turn-helix domain-containing protein [Solihabitans fulvus]